MQIPANYALARLTSITGDEHLIHTIPCLLISRHSKIMKKSVLNKDLQQNLPQPEILQLVKCKSADKNEFGLISYSSQNGQFFIIPFVKILIDDLPCHYMDYQDFINNYQKDPYMVNNVEIESKQNFLVNFSKIYIPCTDCETPHIFYFQIPIQDLNQNRQLKVLKTSIFMPLKNNLNSNKQKIPDKLLAAKWNFDDKDQLKKHLFSYGYGRWKQIQEASKLMGGKLAEKPIQELRLFSNAFLRSMAENLSFDSQDLKQFLYNIIEETSDEPFIQPIYSDWDPQNTLKQKAVIWGKRLQLMYRVQVFIKKFQEQQLKSIPDRDKSKIDWNKLLNFLSSTALVGQKPQLCWNRKHDIDLLRGTYIYGYANYSAIRKSQKLCFHELENISENQDFPSADTVTRRLKKLIQSIMKVESDYGQLNFDQAIMDEDDFEGWNPDEKLQVFNYIKNYGIPLNNEGKQNYNKMKEKLIFEKDKSAGQIEKLVHQLRIKCHQVISDKGAKKEVVIDQNDLEITLCEAQAFNRNLNILNYLYKKISDSSFDKTMDEIRKSIDSIKQDNVGFIKDFNEKCDKQLIKVVIEFGLYCQEELKKDALLQKFELNNDKIRNRLELICNYLKEIYEKQAPTNLKKRKTDRSGADLYRKKSKFEILRDQYGDIIYPLQINNSIKLLNIGQICTLPAYHSEHNLFPIGYKSVRIHSSMFNKGQKCEYTCEIQEGPDGKPLYKLTSDEDPGNPIIRDSSTGCWVYVCQKVNQLQEHRKEKVTISGTERFGLLEPNIVRLLEDLPNVEKCFKYNFKFKDNTIKALDDF